MIENKAEIANFEQMSDDELCKWLHEQRGVCTRPFILYSESEEVLRARTKTFNEMVGAVSSRIAGFKKPYQRNQFMDGVKSSLMDGHYLEAFNDSQYVDFLEQVLRFSHMLRDGLRPL